MARAQGLKLDAAKKWPCDVTCLHATAPVVGLAPYKRRPPDRHFFYVDDLQCSWQALASLPDIIINALDSVTRAQPAKHLESPACSFTHQPSLGPL